MNDTFFTSGWAALLYGFALLKAFSSMVSILWFLAKGKYRGLSTPLRFGRDDVLYLLL